MSDKESNNMVACKYGKHTTDRSNFSPSGLKGLYTICRPCKRQQNNKYFSRHTDKVYNCIARYKERQKAGSRNASQ